jgi:hypothetical protein
MNRDRIFSKFIVENLILINIESPLTFIRYIIIIILVNNNNFILLQKL